MCVCVLYARMDAALVCVCVCVCVGKGGSKGASLPKIKTWQ